MGFRTKISRGLRFSFLEKSMKRKHIFWKNGLTIWIRVIPGLLVATILFLTIRDQKRLKRQKRRLKTTKEVQYYKRYNLDIRIL